MPATTVAKPAADSAPLWAAVDEHLDAFAAAWGSAGEPPAVGRFAPPGPPEVRRLVLAELVKMDLEYRLGRGLDRPLDDYLREFPDLAAGGPPTDLLFEDFHLRRRAGRDPDPADYSRRFPDRAAALARLLGTTPAGRTTSRYAARPPADLAPGDRIDDFVVQARLGAGGFATVYLAVQRSMQRRVALKVSADRGAEAATLAQLDHPHIVRVYDQRTLADRGTRLVYMPYLPGGTLHGVVARLAEVPPDRRSGRTLLEAVDAALDGRGEVPPAASAARAGWAGRSWPAVVAAIGAKLAAALDHAHRQGVLHRDVKPANVLLTAEAEPLLADFNVGSCSKVDGAGPAAFFGGSLPYMAPEHLEAIDPNHPRAADTLDGRADVFGLAVTLWELATGCRPFGPDGGLAALAERRRAGPDPAAVAAFPEAGAPGLRAVLLKGLAPDPADRPAADEMARELELCLRPATRDLLRPAPGGWRGWVRRHPIAVVLTAAVVPNLLASLLNIVYNWSALILKWEDGTGATARAAVEDGRTTPAMDAFDRIIPPINTFFFLLGMGLVAAAVGPVRRGLARVAAGDPPGPDDLAALRRRCLALGRITAGVCAACWAVAGLIWPVAMTLWAGWPFGRWAVFLHFWASLTAFGLIAAAYPYYLVTFVAVRVFYPVLLNPVWPTAADRPALDRTDREFGSYSLVAAATLLLAVAGMLLAGGSDAAGYGAALCGVGLATAGLAYAVVGRTRADLAALADIPAPAGR